VRLALNGTELHWQEHGDGEPLLWLHGGLGCGSDWRYIFKDVPTGCRLIAPDLRGHGASTCPPGLFTFRRCAADMHALLRHLGLARVKVVGLSGGGLTALHMAVADPVSIEAMVLVSAPPRFPEQARAIQRGFSESALSPADRERMLRSHVGGEAQVRRLVEMVHAFADDYDDVDFKPDQLATIRARTLVVFGDRDPLYPVSLAFELHAAIPRSYLWVVPNGGHGPVFGAAAPQFVQTALAFLRGDWPA
jgi:pimeloyl-ACP methyl ester carboxylesterase